MERSMEQAMAVASGRGEGLFEVVQMTAIATVDMTHDNRLRVGVREKAKSKNRSGTRYVVDIGQVIGSTWSMHSILPHVREVEIQD